MDDGKHLYKSWSEGGGWERFLLFKHMIAKLPVVITPNLISWVPNITLSFGIMQLNAVYA